VWYYHVAWPMCTSYAVLNMWEKIAWKHSRNFPIGDSHERNRQQASELVNERVSFQFSAIHEIRFKSY
jgi:hypothetical protein